MPLTDQNGKSIVLDRKLGSGGEADIYAIAGNADLVAKIYFRHSSERQAKLQAMIGTPPPDPTGGQGHVSICWPKALLFDQGRVGVGFLMHRVDFSTSVPVLRLYNPQDRQQVAPGFTWAYLLRTAVLIASVVEAIHACGYVVGDLNESNFLVSDRTLVTLVDCDSMQVPNGKGRFFRCTVGKPEFTAPELQGRDFGQVDRNTAHDNFALGVMIFQLLMEGIHPYAGIWRGQGDPPSLEERIRSGDCAYAGSVNISPMPAALPIELLPASLKSLVARCFGHGHNDPAMRPSPREWREGLTAVEKNLRICAANTQHVYPTHLTACPWCARTVLLRGFDPFASVAPQQPMAATPFIAPRPQVVPQPAPQLTVRPVVAPLPAYYPTPITQAATGPSGFALNSRKLVLAYFGICALAVGLYAVWPRQQQPVPASTTTVPATSNQTSGARIEPIQQAVKSTPVLAKVSYDGKQIATLRYRDLVVTVDSLADPNKLPVPVAAVCLRATAFISLRRCGLSPMPSCRQYGRSTG